jgi:lipopolysaccharide export system protein LptA
VRPDAPDASLVAAYPELACVGLPPDDVGQPPCGETLDDVGRGAIVSSGRTDVWRGALSQAAERPVVGYGFGTEDRVFVERYTFFQGDYVENSYLGLLLQLGAAGLALLVALLAAAAAGPAAAQGIDLSRGGPVDVTATDGIEWRQADQVVIARGDARAVRGGATVDADRLMARYRPSRSRAGAAAAAPAPGKTPEAALGGSSEIWRLEAEGNVRISTATDTARGDRAVYDIDQAVLVLTGRALQMTSGQQVITARDSLEYWSTRRMAVARGDALVVDRAENRRIRADTLVAYFLEDAQGTADAPARPPPVRPAAAAPGAREAPGAGRIERVEGFGNVEIRTATEVVRGDRGVYSPATCMARLLGAVRITRGDNQLNGREAIVNMCTGVARLVSTPGGRVQGLIQPNQDAGGAAAPQGGSPAGQPRR